MKVNRRDLGRKHAVKAAKCRGDFHAREGIAKPADAAAAAGRGVMR